MGPSGAFVSATVFPRRVLAMKYSMSRLGAFEDGACPAFIHHEHARSAYASILR